MRRHGSARMLAAWPLTSISTGCRSVRLNGRVFEACAARLAHRAPCDLYHSALEGALPAIGPFVIEMTPVARGDRRARGAVVEGPVGARWAGRLRIFRYEVRRWPGGVIPDVAEAVASPHRLTDEATVAQRVWDLVPALPTPVWGRDEVGAGDMWNANSVIAWLLARTGLAAGSIHPPEGGRAPGWSAGIDAAHRSGAPIRRPALTAILDRSAGWRSGRTHRS
jgi:hypothetical protein